MKYIRLHRFLDNDNFTYMHEYAGKKYADDKYLIMEDIWGQEEYFSIPISDLPEWPFSLVDIVDMFENYGGDREIWRYAASLILLAYDGDPHAKYVLDHGAMYGLLTGHKKDVDALNKASESYLTVGTPMFTAVGSAIRLYAYGIRHLLDLAGIYSYIHDFFAYKKESFKFRALARYKLAEILEGGKR